MGGDSGASLEAGQLYSFSFTVSGVLETPAEKEMWPGVKRLRLLLSQLPLLSDQKSVFCLWATVSKGIHLCPGTLVILSVGLSQEMI